MPDTRRIPVRDLRPGDYLPDTDRTVESVDTTLAYCTVIRFVGRAGAAYLPPSAHVNVTVASPPPAPSPVLPGRETLFAPARAGEVQP